MGAARLATVRSSIPEPLEKSVDHLLEECRMVLPGVQALFGFQLIAVFNQPFFAVLSAAERELHLAALVLVSLSVALVMAPAAYHRQAEPQRVSARFVAYASRMLMLAMVTLMIAVPLDVYVIARVILAAPPLAAAIAAGVFAAFGTAWFVIPWRARTVRARRSRRPAGG
jgi:hypothetical protein